MSHQRALKFSLIALLTVAICSTCAASIALDTSSRATKPSDVIGSYVLEPVGNIIDSRRCPRNLTFKTFEFDAKDAPSILPAPRRFNILVRHAVTQANGRNCESSGAIVAVQSGHPYSRNLASAIISTWARGGGPTSEGKSLLAKSDLLSSLERSAWVFGYDFQLRSCRGTVVRPGTAYMWYQPSWDITLSTSPRVMLRGRYKYLLLTHRRRPKRGCVYRATAVGGQGSFPLGPVSDPSRGDKASSTKTSGPTTSPSPQRPVSSSAPRAQTSPRPARPSTEETSTEPTPESGSEGSRPGMGSGGRESEGSQGEQKPPVESPPPSLSPRPSGFIPFGKEKPRATTKSDPGQVFGRDTTNKKEAAAVCFPGSSTVQLADGTRVRMDSLSRGMSVRSEANAYSPVYLFSHRAVDRVHSFVRIETSSGRNVTLSHSHYLYLNGHRVVAEKARRGDRAELEDGTFTSVLRVRHVRGLGLYAPHTLHGDIFVDGIRASGYTRAVNPTFAHFVLLAPLRGLYRIGALPDRMAQLVETAAPAIARVLQMR